MNAHPFYGELYYFEELPSTNDFAKKPDCRSNAVVLTSFQSSGRGRFERKWITTPNENLTFTLKLKLPLSPSDNRYLIYYTSWIVYYTIKEILESAQLNPDSLNIKWPNDILWNNSKLAGILTESVVKSGEYIIGIGININQKNFGPEIEAISIAEISKNAHNLTGILIQFLSRFEESLSLLETENHSRLFDLWLKSTKMVGRKCSYLSGNSSLRYGFIRGLNEDGSITIESGGISASFVSGEVKILDY